MDEPSSPPLAPAPRLDLLSVVARPDDADKVARVAATLGLTLAQTAYSADGFALAHQRRPLVYVVGWTLLGGWGLDFLRMLRDASLPDEAFGTLLLRDIRADSDGSFGVSADMYIMEPIHRERELAQMVHRLHRAATDGWVSQTLARNSPMRRRIVPKNPPAAD